jgi:hypothetical protein
VGKTSGKSTSKFNFGEIESLTTLSNPICYSSQTELRSAVVSSLASDESSDNVDVQFSSTEAKQRADLRTNTLRLNRSARLAIALISDFCDVLGLNATRAVLSHETGLSFDEVTYISQSELASSVGEAHSGDKSPSSILVRLVSSVSNDVVIGDKGTSSSSKSGISNTVSSIKHGRGISNVLGLGPSVNRLVLSALDTSEERSGISDSLSSSGIKSPNALSDAEDRSPVAPAHFPSTLSRGGAAIQTVVPSLADTVRPSSSRGKFSQTGRAQSLSLTSILEKDSPQKQREIGEEDDDDDYVQPSVRVGGRTTYNEGGVIRTSNNNEDDEEEGDDVAEVNLSGDDR